MSYLPLMIIFAIWIGVYQSVDNKTDKLFSHLKMLENMESRFLNNHRLLQAFLLRGYKDPGFYKSGNEPHIDEFISTQLQLQNAVRKLKFQFAQQGIDTQAEIDSLFIRNTEFIRSIEYLKALMYERGYRDQGALGKMRTLALRLEDSALVPAVSILQLRRLEKDFLLRGNPEYATDFNSLADEIKSSPRIRSHGRDVLSSYQNSFNRVVQLDQRLGISTNTNAYLRVQEEMASLGTFYESMVDDVAADIEEVSLRWKRQLWIVSFLLLALAIAVSIFLSKDLTRDIRVLNKKIFAFVKSQFKTHRFENFEPRTTEMRHLNRDFEKLITELETTLERMNKEKRKAEETAEYKSLFLANMSHEIRTPLNGVIGMLHMLKGTRLTQKQKQYMEVVEYSANHLLDLVSMILDHSKMDAKKLELEHHDIELAEDMAKLVKIFEFRAREKGVEIELHYEGEHSRMVRGDSLRLQQVLINLLNNALKFTDHGKVTLKVHQLWLKDERQKYRFEVVDNGIGISSEQQKRLFQAFEQADSSTTRKYGGTGLGLTISYQLVELMGGQLQVKSQKGEGSSFSFELEFKRGKKATAKIQRPQILNAKKPEMGKELFKVLLAEDNPVNQKVLTLMLENNGAEVSIANNGLEAVDRFKEKEFDIILMDLQMPEMDGLEATRVIKASERYQKLPLPIIAVTANAFSEDRKKALEAGMDDFLTKPVKPQAFQELLAKYAPGLVV